MNKTTRTAALRAGLIYEGEERRASARTDGLCAGLQAAVLLLEELKKAAPAWAVWRWAWVPFALKVFRSVVAVRCGGGEAPTSGEL